MPKPSLTDATSNSQLQEVTLTHQTNFMSIHGLFINSSTLSETIFDASGYISPHHHNIPTASRLTASHSKVPKSRRSQRLTDKITCLQKLVSPYGKTDTASVLLEASISIEALQNQIQKLLLVQCGQTYKRGEERSRLQSKGLCLVPAVILKQLDTQLAPGGSI